MNKILRRTITVTLTQQQYDALLLAVDDHAQSLADNLMCRGVPREAAVLDRAWNKLADAWSGASR